MPYFTITIILWLIVIFGGHLFERWIQKCVSLMEEKDLRLLQCGRRIPFRHLIGYGLCFLILQKAQDNRTSRMFPYNHQCYDTTETGFINGHL